MASRQVYPANGVYMDHSNSGSTDESPFGSSLTTPVDEDAAKSFERMGEKLLTDYDMDLHLTPKPPAIETYENQDMITPKPLSLFKSVGQARKLAKGLVPRTKTPVKESPAVVASSATSHSTQSDSEFLFNVCDTSSVVAHSRTPSLYSMPNSSLLQSRESSSDISETITRGLLSRSASLVGLCPSDSGLSVSEAPDSPNVLSAITPANSLNAIDSFIVPEASTFSELSKITIKTVPSLVAKLFCFLPWCVLVGGAIMLAPRYLEIVAFSPGYIASPRGIRRFAHWTECAIPHIMIFLASVAAVVWWNLALGVVLASGIVGQTVLAWHDFVPDNKIALGEDDRQTIYLAIMVYVVSEDLVTVKRKETGYVIDVTGGRELEADDPDVNHEAE